MRTSKTSAVVDDDLVFPSARRRAKRGESAEEPAFPIVDHQGRRKRNEIRKRKRSKVAFAPFHFSGKTDFSSRRRLARETLPARHRSKDALPAPSSGSLSL